MAYPIGNATDVLTVHPQFHNAVVDVMAHFQATGAGTGNDGTAFQNAINAAETAGPGAVVFCPPPPVSYNITSTVILKSGVSLVAAPGTPITGGIASDYLFRSTAATALDDVTLDGFDINMASVGNKHGIWVEYASRFAMRNMRIRNVGTGASPAWGAVIGVTNGADTVIRNSDILIENCTFDTHGGSLEPLLLMNAKDVTVRKCKFRNLTTANGHAIGIFQVIEGCLIDDCTFDPITGKAAYYCVSCNNVTFRDNRFLSGGGVMGSSQSDNGAFGATHTLNLQVKGNHFTNCNSAGALQLGAVRGARVKDNKFYENSELCVLVDDGNTPIAAASDDIIISGNQFRNNNNSAAVYGYNVPIMFQSAAALNVEITDNQFWDDQGTQTQRNLITFSGAFTWDHITIANNRLSPDVANSGKSLNPLDSAVLGTNVRSYGNRTNESLDVASAGTVTLPHYSDYLNITGTTTITSVTASWIGRQVTLKFAGVLTFTDGSNLKLNGNFVTTADDTITLMSDGTNWYEVARSAN